MTNITWLTRTLSRVVIFALLLLMRRFIGFEATVLIALAAILVDTTAHDVRLDALSERLDA